MTERGSARRTWLATVAGVAVAAGLQAGIPSSAVAAGSVAGGLEVTGQPLVHEFDLSAPGDSVQTTWAVRHRGAGTVQFDGALVATGGADSELARALRVEFGTVDRTGNVSWSSGGSVVDARLFSGTLSGSAAVDVPVRVVLARPDLVTTAKGRQVVTADFVVRYLPADQDRAGTGDPNRRLLAITGDDVLPLLLVGFSLLMIGRGIVMFTRVRRRARPHDDHREPRDS